MATGGSNRCRDCAVIKSYIRKQMWAVDKTPDRIAIGIALRQRGLEI